MSAKVQKSGSPLALCICALGLMLANTSTAQVSLKLISRGDQGPLDPCAGIQQFTPLCLIPNTVGGVLQDNVFTCNLGAQRGAVFVGSEVEPHLAVNPTNPKRMVAIWQQDRWARLGGGASVVLAHSFDGGDTWTLTNPLLPFSRCAGAQEGNPGAYDRSSDPWVLYDKTGALYSQSLVFDGLSPRPSGAIVISRSSNDGVSWGFPTTEVTDIVTKEGSGSVPLLDKNSLTADPLRMGPNGDPVLYATWGLGTNKSDLYFSRSFDGGETWEARKKIYTTEGDLPQKVGKNAVLLNGALIKVMSNGTLVIVFERNSEKVAFRDFALIRSFDGGKTWEKSVTVIATVNPGQVIDPELLDASGQIIPIRDSQGDLAEAATSADRTILYVAFQDANAAGNVTTAFVTRSTDVAYPGVGPTFSTPVKVNNSTASAFMPLVHVDAASGTVGVIYTDMRNDQPGPVHCNASSCGPLSADIFLAQFDAALTPRVNGNLTDSTTWITASKSIDYRQAPLLFGSGGVVPGGYFLGDYFGLADSEGNFVMAVALTNGQCAPAIPADPNALNINVCNRTDIYFSKVPVSK